MTVRDQTRHRVANLLRRHLGLRSCAWIGRGRSHSHHVAGLVLAAIAAPPAPGTVDRLATHLCEFDGCRPAPCADHRTTAGQVLKWLANNGHLPAGPLSAGYRQRVAAESDSFHSPTGQPRRIANENV